jgi:LemA protein
LVKLKNLVAEAWSGIDVQLKKRYDLIPNLVETVKGYAAHEKETFENVTKARAAAQQATTVEGQQAAENKLNGALMNLMAVAERYPDLKANTNFLALQSMPWARWKATSRKRGATTTAMCASRTH